MRFTIEERLLTDAAGKPAAMVANVSFHVCDADTVDEAVRVYTGRDDAQLIGNVLKFPGFQAVATVRKATGVYTLQFTPASQQGMPAIDG
jgi:hypothetical protein